MYQCYAFIILYADLLNYLGDHATFQSEMNRLLSAFMLTALLGSTVKCSDREVSITVCKYTILSVVELMHTSNT